MIKIYSVPRMGDIGKDVVVFQQALVAKGFNPGMADGIFGSKTKTATAGFQKSKGLPGSGVVGPLTLKYLGLEVVAVSPVTGKNAVTKDLQGKKDRHIHPSIRLQVESHLFPGGVVTSAFLTKNVPQAFIEANYALAKVGIVETGGNNKGDLVGKVQGTTGSYTPGGNGDAWCLDYAQIPIGILEDYFGVESPVPATAHCLTCWNGAKIIPGLTTTKFEVGTMALGNYKGTASGHAMNALKSLSATTMQTNEGNTSIKSLNDGDGSGLKVRNKGANGTLSMLGYVRVYPNNKLPG